jgi:putative salt-induced outer membrane protein YdiY
MKRLFPLFLCACCASAMAQVINIENRRFLNDTDGFVGKVDMNFSINQNVEQVMSFGSNIHAQYVKKRHRILAIGDLSFIKAAKQDFVNAGYQHLRYNYKLTGRLTWEAFVQAQYNKVLLLDRRYLAGTGPRFKVVKKEAIRLYLGLLYMREYQSQNNDSIKGWYHRLSGYFTFTYTFQKMDFTNTTFFQPNIEELADYRIASDSALELAINNHFNFKAGFNLLYDIRQPKGIPALTYALRNGLSFKF